MVSRLLATGQHYKANVMRPPTPRPQFFDFALRPLSLFPTLIAAHSHTQHHKGKGHSHPLRPAPRATVSAQSHTLPCPQSGPFAPRSPSSLVPPSPVRSGASLTLLNRIPICSPTPLSPRRFHRTIPGTNCLRKRRRNAPAHPSACANMLAHRPCSRTHEEHPAAGLRRSAVLPLWSECRAQTPVKKSQWMCARPLVHFSKGCTFQQADVWCWVHIEEGFTNLSCQAPVHIRAPRAQVGKSTQTS